MRISSISIERPVFALMLVLGLVVLGLVSLSRLNLDLNPAVEFPFVSVSTQLYGASPETIERAVTDVLEEELNTLEGIRTLSSRSSAGLSLVFIEFGLEFDPARKAQQVRERVARARALLPPDIEEPLVEQIDPDSNAIIKIMLSGPYSVRELSEYTKDEIATRFERLKGVGKVHVLGARDREIRIWLDPIRLTGYGLSIEDVGDTVRSENADMAGGHIEGPSREWSVTMSGRVRKVEDFGALIVAERDGALVKLRDVAVIEDGMEDERTITRLNGQRGVALEIQRQSGANTVAVARAVRAEVEEIRSDLPAGMEILITGDQAVYIERSIGGIYEDMLLGGLLAVLVVLFFLRNPRSTLIAAVSIPSSVVASFTLVYMAGFTLNSMTLMALSLSIGLVIDDSIVVLEAIVRRLERGDSPMQAAQHGVSSVGLAVISTTLAVCAVFVPIAFMRGMMGQWFYEFGLVVAFTVSISTLVAITLTPMLASRFLVQAPAKGRLFVAFGRWYTSFENLHRRILAWALRRTALTLSLAAAFVIAGCGVATTLPFDLFQDSDQAEFQLQVVLPLGTPLPVSDRVARRVESALADADEVRAVYTTVGSGVQHRPNETSFYVRTSPREERDLTLIELKNSLRDQIAAIVPEAREVRADDISWMSSGRRDAVMTYALRGPDLDRLSGHADELVALMRGSGIFTDVSVSHESGRPEIELEIARDRAADLGVPAVKVGRTLRALLAGEKVGSFEDVGDRFDVRVRVLPEYRDDPGKLDLIRVRSLRGELVPITNLVRSRIGEGAVEISRENRARQITLYANLASGVALGDAVQQIEDWGPELGIESPDELVSVGRARAMGEAAYGVAFAFMLAMVAIYMILASLFNSVVHPFTIMTSAPLSFIGGFLALKLAGMPLDMMSGIGLLVLMGLVMKNGILLVDYINQLRHEGRTREEAILEAAPARMRPVLMTTGALVFGMLPIALQLSAGSAFRAPMAVINVGGLITSTLLTLVFVPVIYSVLDGLAHWVRARTRRLVPGRKEFEFAGERPRESAETPAIPSAGGGN